MIKSTKDGRKITAHQLAKEAIADRLQLVEYFMEGYPDEWDAMTEREQDDFGLACEKKVDALLRYLRVDYRGQPHQVRTAMDRMVKNVIG